MVKNHKLAKSISDASWGEFVRQLEYKCEWYGKTLVKIPAFFASSQTCHICGYKNETVKNLAVRSWVCPGCQAEHDRDVNAAKNILIKGLEMLA
jgi:putative transposase